jgi:hypothetical protein
MYIRTHDHPPFVKRYVHVFVEAASLTKRTERVLERIDQSGEAIAKFQEIAHADMDGLLSILGRVLRLGCGAWFGQDFLSQVRESARRHESTFLVSLCTLAYAAFRKLVNIPFPGKESDAKLRHRKQICVSSLTSLLFFSVRQSEPPQCLVEENGNCFTYFFILSRPMD